jgi:hypothetical protein
MTSTLPEKRSVIARCHEMRATGCQVAFNTSVSMTLLLSGAAAARLEGTRTV